METVRSWVLTCCMACVVTGLLRFFAPRQEKISVIKLVLSLYILVSVFAPLRTAQDFSIELPEQPAASIAPMDTDARILEASRENLCRLLMDACEKRGAPVKNIDVALSEIAGELCVAQVTVRPNNMQQADDVRAVLQEQLGAEVVIVLQEEAIS